MHWFTASVHRLSLYLVGTPVVFRVEECSIRVDQCSFLRKSKLFGNFKYLFITLLNSTLFGREKKNTIRRHTKLRSVVYSNSLVMNNQNVGVITTRLDAMTFRFHFVEYSKC